MGTPLFASHILRSIMPYVEIVLVVTQPDHYMGRKKILSYNPVKTLALEYHLKTFQPLKIKDNFQDVIDAKPDLIITAAYGQFIPEQIITLCKAINVHGSLLPKYRGGAPIQHAIINGDSKTGITIIHMTKKMDAGHMILKKELNIDNTDTYTTVSDKLSQLGAKAIIEIIETFGHHIPLGIEQDQKEVSFAYTLKSEDERLYFNQTAKQFINRMRALLDQPVGHIVIDQQSIKVYDAKISDIIVTGKPGEIIETHHRLVIMCQDQPIELLSIQMQGKKRMDIKAFLNGQKIFVKHKVLI